MVPTGGLSCRQLIKNELVFPNLFKRIMLSRSFTRLRQQLSGPALHWRGTANSLRPIEVKRRLAAKALAEAVDLDQIVLYQEEESLKNLVIDQFAKGALSHYSADEIDLMFDNQGTFVKPVSAD
jgi:hypothetical protein